MQLENNTTDSLKTWGQNGRMEKGDSITGLQSLTKSELFDI